MNYSGGYITGSEIALRGLGVGFQDSNIVSDFRFSCSRLTLNPTPSTLNRMTIGVATWKVSQCQDTGLSASFLELVVIAYIVVT